jgi:hypothetical protein
MCMIKLFPQKQSSIVITLVIVGVGRSLRNVVESDEIFNLTRHLDYRTSFWKKYTKLRTERFYRTRKYIAIVFVRVNIYL